MKKDLAVSIPAADLELNTYELYVKYEQFIISAFDWVESTQKSYRNVLSRSSKYICNIPFCDCSTDDFQLAIDSINESRRSKSKKDYSNNTLKGFRSVFADLCYFAEVYSNGLYSSAVWGSDWKITITKKPAKTPTERKERDEEEIRDRINLKTILPRSLLLEQEIELYSIMESDIETNSYYAGIALCFYLGLRPGECCGVTFGDIRQLEGHPDAWCLYVYEQLTDSGKTSNDLKTANAYRVLPIPEELSDFLFKRKEAVKNKLRYECDECYIVCENETIEGLRKPCSRRRFRAFAQKVLRSIKVEERVVINLSKEIHLETTSEEYVTTYLLRRNFATALSGVCGMDDDELKYLLGHAIGSADERRRDFVNPDILYRLWNKLNKRTFKKSYNHSPYNFNQMPIITRQKEAVILFNSTDTEGEGVYLRVFNEFPNDYIYVTIKDGDKDKIKYRTAMEPSELKRIGRLRLHNEFAEAVEKMRKKKKK